MNNQIIGRNTIKKIMKSITDKSISFEAVYLMRERVEEIIFIKTKEAEQILEQKNKFRKIQKMKPLKKISYEDIEEAFQNE